MKKNCIYCIGYQQEELGAGLLSNCVTDELYADEECQIIKPEVNEVVTAFMLGRIDDCPYFKVIDTKKN